MGRKEWDFGFGPNWWFGEQRRHRSRRAWFGQGDMKYVILRLLRDKSMHGYEVMKALEEKTHGCYKPSPGAVYPTLQWLEDEGLVKLEVVEGKKIYHITQAGKDFLDQNKTTVEDIFERVSDTIDRIFDDPGPDVSREVGKLVGQAYKTAWKKGRSPETKKRILKVLRETTAKLEEMASSREAE